MAPFFGELYLRSTKPFLPEEVTRAECDYLAGLFDSAALPPGPVLDLGCGHGRHLHGVAERIARPVVGLDFDALSLAEAAPAPRVRGDFFALPFSARAFAGCYCWYNTAFTFEDDRQLPLFKELARVLAPRSLLVLQTAPVERIRTLGDSKYDGLLPDGSRLVETCHFDPQKERDEGHRTLTLPDGRVMAAAYFIRYYSRAALAGLLETAGFRVSFWHAGVHGQPPSGDSADLIVGALRGDS